MNRPRNQRSAGADDGIERIFEDDEMSLRKIDETWSREDLLAQEGIFFLKDVAALLKMDSARVVKRVKAMAETEENPWRVMGIRKMWNHWVVRMKVFAPYYRANLFTRVQPVDASWDSNQLLQQPGHFLLSEVCELIPFSTYQIRYQAKQNKRAREEYGIWKDPVMSRFVVDMPVFSSWIKSLWQGNFAGR